MEARFNADEMLAMAEQIERNGRDFYRAAAVIAPDEKSMELLAELARWEEGHESVFIKMRCDLPDDQRALPLFDSNTEHELYLQAIADTRVFDMRKEVTVLARELGSIRDILSYAMKMEHDSILFYVGLRGAVPPEFGRRKVDDLIKEEMDHVAFLKKRLAELEAATA